MLRVVGGERDAILHDICRSFQRCASGVKMDQLPDCARAIVLAQAVFDAQATNSCCPSLLLQPGGGYSTSAVAVAINLLAGSTRSAPTFSVAEDFCHFWSLPRFTGSHLRYGMSSSGTVVRHRTVCTICYLEVVYSIEVKTDLLFPKTLFFFLA